jgi:type IX secretion system PorP/SprF family membrane protein
MPKPHHGLGAIMQRDKSGAISTSALNISYAYHLPVTKQIKVAAGASTGFIKYTIDPNQMNLFDLNDPIFGNGNLNQVMYDLQVGLWAYSHKFYTGVSSSQLLINRKDMMHQERFKNSSTLQRHYNLTAGYKLDVSSRFAIIPSTLVKFASPSTPAIDVNLKFMYDDRVFVGGSYRRNDAFVAIAGLHLNTVLDFGYSYDATASELNAFNAGSHEFVLGLKLFNKKKIICPSHLW